jgi:hypothetical protein
LDRALAVGFSLWPTSARASSAERDSLSWLEPIDHFVLERLDTRPLA